MNLSHIVSLLALSGGGPSESAPEPALPPEPVWITASYHDVTDDGVPDKLAVDATGHFAVLVNKGARRFERVAQRFPALVPTAYLVGDLDGDGATDLYLVTAGANVALRGLGGGAFEDATERLGLADRGHGVRAERRDLDGDGRADVLLENATGQTVFWAEPDGTYRRDAAESVLPLAPGPSALALLTNPPGTIVAFAGAAPPPGYLLCDGSEVGRLDYPELFRACGVTYGAGNLTTTFNLPDLTGRFPLGLAGSGTGSVLGETGGSLDHVHATPAHTHDVGAHRHGLAGHTHSQPSHDHSIASHDHRVPQHYHGKGTLGITSTAGSTHAHGLPTRNNVANHANSGNSLAKAEPRWAGASHFGTLTDGGHVHPNSAFSGTVGSTSGSNNGDSGFDTDPAKKVSGSGTVLSGLGGDEDTGGPSPSNSDLSTVFQTSSETGGDTTSANAPFIAITYIIKT